MNYFSRLIGQRSLAEKLFYKKQNILNRILNKRALSPTKIGLPTAIVAAKLDPVYQLEAYKKYRRKIIKD